MLTITNTGADDVSCNFTARTLNKFKGDDGVAEEVSCGKLHLANSESGWVNQVVAIEYLKWTSNVAQNQAQYLIWDVYPAHRSEAVKATATHANIHLSFVPRGQTGT